MPRQGELRVKHINYMKLIKLSCVFMMLCFCPCINIFAGVAVYDGIYYKTNGNYASVMAYPGSGEYSGNISIPSSFTYEGVTYTVNGIGDDAFMSCNDLTSITLPNTITTIGDDAFYGCDNISSIIIPSKVTSIGSSAFGYCRGLKKVIVTDLSAWCKINFKNYSSNPLTCAEHLYNSNGVEIKHLTIPEDVTAIGNNAFCGCSGLTSVTLPSSVITIGNNAFVDCSGLTNVTLSSSVTTVGTSAFSHCSGLTNITLPSSVTTIGASAFEYCTSLSSMTLPSSVKTIEPYTFRSCSNLTSITIGNGVITIGSSAFYDCTRLSSVIIPNNVKTIGSQSFHLCTSLKTVIIGSGVSDIATDSFLSCHLKSVTVNSNAIISKDYSSTSSLKDIFGNVNEFILGESINTIGKYAFNDYLSLSSFIIPKNVKKIGNNAFSGCSNIKQATINSNSIINNYNVVKIFNNTVNTFIIGDDVTSIGTGSFSEGSFNSISIPNSVTSIGNKAFYSCNHLQDVTLPESVNGIGESAFEKSAVKTITIPNNVSCIKRRTFYGCKNLSSIIIPNSVKTIEESVFYGCSSLPSINIPTSITDIGNSAFHDCTGLTSVIIPNNVTVINNSVFYNCTGLTSISIPNSVTSIGSSAFSNCTSLTSITIPNSVTSIGSSAFIGCTGLTSFTIPNTVTSLGYSSFQGCTGLTSVTIGDGITSIESETFKNCNSLPSIIIPNSVTSIAGGAFIGCTSLNSVTLPDNISSFGRSGGLYPFDSKCKLYVRKGSTTLLALWDGNYGKSHTILEIGTESQLPKPALSSVDATQTTLTLKIDNFCEGYLYYYYGYNSGEKIAIDNDEFTVYDLFPDYDLYTHVYVATENYEIHISDKFPTKSLSPTISIVAKTASSIEAIASYTEGDAVIEKTNLYFNGKEVGGDAFIVTGLDPNHSYRVDYNVKVSYGGYFKSYNHTSYLSTSPLTLTTLQPKVVSSGNVIVAAESNIDDAEKNVGFEWRRTDWSDDFASNSGAAYLYEGMMEGYIRNLNTEKLWKYRPYYVSDSGTYYYGEWIGLDPTNTSYFEPTVHTYANITVDGNSASIEGLTLPGSDGVASQGFQYWETTSGANEAMMAPAHAPAIPGNAKTVEVSGQVMTATLTGLNYGTTYNYVAFVKTTNGETFYGEVRSFTTEPGATGIYEITDGGSSAAEVHEVARYNLNGQPIDTPERGINIIRYSDGSTRKVVVK